MSEIKSIKVQLSGGEILDCSIAISQAPQWRLNLLGIEGASEASGKDLYEALVVIRQRLELIGARLLCQGARREVVPSGMSRDMGGGRLAYVTSLGSSARRSDLVDIFDRAEPNSVGSVAEQKVFRQNWNSLRKLV